MSEVVGCTKRIPSSFIGERVALLVDNLDWQWFTVDFVAELGQVASILGVGGLQDSSSVSCGEDSITIALGISCAQVSVVEMGMQFVAVVMGAGGDDGSGLLGSEARKMVEFDEGEVRCSVVH